jgi:SAM-dependent methyltransferase
VEIANADMAAAWDGDEGDDWSRDWERYDRSLAIFHRALMDAAAIGRNQRVLDVGCGNGQTTCDAARAASAGSALGVDLSSQMLARARDRAAAAGIANARFEQADAQVHRFEPGGVDLALSRFGVMFFGDPVAAFTNIAGALAPGGRLVFATWQPPERQEWLAALRGALALGRDLPLPPTDRPGPFSLSDPDRTRRLLEDAGFRDVEVEGVDGEFWMGDDADDAYAWVSGMGVARGLLAGVSDAERAEGLTRLRAVVDASVGPGGASIPSTAWVVSASGR